MRMKMVALILAILLYVPVGLVGADCLAGVLFDVTNKRVPESVSWDRWPEAWQAYREDATQRKRLQFSAGLGLFTLFGLPVLLGLSLTQRTTALHGAARFANPSEIAGAGLYGEQGIIVGKVGRR